VDSKLLLESKDNEDDDENYVYDLYYGVDVSDEVLGMAEEGFAPRLETFIEDLALENEYDDSDVSETDSNHEDYYQNDYPDEPCGDDDDVCHIKPGHGSIDNDGGYGYRSQLGFGDSDSDSESQYGINDNSGGYAFPSIQSYFR